MDRAASIKAIRQWLTAMKNDEADLWADLIVDHCFKNGIDTPEKLAMFVAQCAHESNCFKVTVENLNYSYTGLMSVWPSRFKTSVEAQRYDRKPEAIANKAYADRMGNGNEQSGDGWKYRGRGIIQLTGKANYQLASKDLYDSDLLEHYPDLVGNHKTVAMETAIWFWKKHNLDQLSDVVAVTKKINGGINGLEDRQKKYLLLCETIKAISSK